MPSDGACDCRVTESYATASVQCQGRPMTKWPLILMVLVMLVVPVAAEGRSTAYGLTIRGATVNRDHSVTIDWALENANVSNASIAVDGYTVASWSFGDRSTSFRTRPLSGGWHTISI